MYTDSGHGCWVAVKAKTLADLGLSDKISTFSFMKGKTVYLEEDQDLTTFVNAYMTKFGEKPEFVTKHTEKRSPIRTYQPYVFVSV